MKKLFLLFLILVGISWAQTNPTPQSLPYTQDFSSLIGSTTVFPDGWQGWTVSGSLSTTSLKTAPSANQSLAGGTNATTTAGVYDMVGKMGILSTGSNVKAIALAINTTSLTDITVSYLAQTQRCENTRVDALQLQYRIGTTGNFDTLAVSEYINNLLPTNTTGTDGINPQTISVTLPSACNNQAIVQLRWIIRDISGSGNRPSFSIDDISISGTTSIITPTKLAITNINGGVNPTANVPFNVTIQAQDNGGSAANVTANTDVTLSVATGTGTLGGTITGTILAGTSSVVISGATYSVGESGVSLTATRTSGDILTPGTSALFTVVGAADHLTFTTFPLTGQSGYKLGNITVEAQRTDGSRDLTYTGNVTLAVNSGPGTISGTVTAACVAGTVTFSNVILSEVGNYTLSASSGSLTGAVSNSVTLYGLTNVLLPKYVQGLNGTNNNRIPYVFRATITNLLPNATYRFINQVINYADGVTTSGAGNCMFVNSIIDSPFVRTSSPTLANTGPYGTLTTDATGSATGWFITEPTGNARFTPGGYVSMRIRINDGNEGTTAVAYLTTLDSVQVIDFGTTSSASTGSAIFGKSYASAKDFVFLYDNISGTGRPLSSSIVESDGFNWTGITTTALFYRDSVDNNNGNWGTIIPNQLPDGVRRIERRSFADGSINSGTAIDADGVWPSGVNTVDPTNGLTPLGITINDAPLIPATTAIKLAVTNINGGNAPTANANFSVVVQAQDLNNNPANVVANTGIVLSRATGTGTLGGTLTGTISAGSNTVTINDVNYNLVENGVSITASRTSGDNLTPGTSALFNVLEGATHLAFVTLPANGQAGLKLGTITVEARRSDNTKDASFTGNVTLSINSGTGTLSGTLSVAAIAGTATFTNVVFDQTGTFTLSASSGSLTNGVSNSISILGLTTELLPQYIQGLNGTNNTRVPYVFRASLSNLLPNATYRFINQIVIYSDGATTNGAGNVYFVPSNVDSPFVRTSSPDMSVGPYGTLTADSNGNYTGWFVTEPTGNARFVPGNYIKMRIRLNDGNNGTVPVTWLTTLDSVKIIDFGTEDLPTKGTAIYGASLSSAKDFVFLYDNETGSGRPISSTFVESDGVNLSGITQIPAFYKDSVDTKDGYWGTIIPNQLPNGIRRIERRLFADGSLHSAVALDADGIWPSGANTTNPNTGLTPVVITVDDAPLAVTAPTTFQLSVTVANGWNMVSVPGLHPTDQNVNTWWNFRDPLASVYKWSGGSYSPVTTAAPTEGYWLLHSGARTYNTGDEWPAGGIQLVAHNPITVSSGWNMIGGYDNSASVSGLTTTPPGLIVPGTVYGWNGGYYNPTNLEPGYGYWILLTGSGVINPPTALKGGSTAKETNTEGWGKIIVTDASGKSYTLYSVKGEVNLMEYQLPPLPPAGLFDVRFGSGRKAEDLKTSQTIEMQGLVYPIIVKSENMDIRLQDVSGTVVNQSLKSGESVTISNSSVSKLMVSATVIPDKYSLEQNYPNPFNPSTVISFSLPEDASNVRLTIYDALGQKVAELVNGKLEAGKYQYTWNAGNNATGLYIYELRTDKFVSIKKMLMVK